MATKDNEMSFASSSLIDDATLDQLMAQIDAKGLELLGPDGVLTGVDSSHGLGARGPSWLRFR